MAGLIAVLALAAVASIFALNALAAARADRNPAAPGGAGKDAGVVRELAPIESADLLIAESFPPQYTLHVQYGLPNGCARPGGYDVDQHGPDITVSVWIQVPSDPSTACTMIYGTGDHNISLGSGFRSGQTYAITLNGRPFTTLVAQ